MAIPPLPAPRGHATTPWLPIASLEPLWQQWLRQHRAAHSKRVDDTCCTQGRRVQASCEQRGLCQSTGLRSANDVQASTFHVGIQSFQPLFHSRLHFLPDSLDSGPRCLSFRTLHSHAQGCYLLSTSRTALRAVSASLPAPGSSKTYVSTGHIAGNAQSNRRKLRVRCCARARRRLGTSCHTNTRVLRTGNSLSHCYADPRGIPPSRGSVPDTANRTPMHLRNV